MYRNLESQGYSKDLGERGDLLSPPLDGRRQRHFIKEAKKIKATDLDDAMHGLTLLNNDIAPHKDLLTGSRGAIRDTQSSSYDNVSSQESFAKRGQMAAANSSHTQKNVNALKTKTLQRSPVQPMAAVVSVPVAAPESTSKSATLDLRRARKSNQDAQSNVDAQKGGANKAVSGSVRVKEEKWECSACTYFNSASVEICEMCGKSKTIVLQTMEIGGSQCPACTLVNPKDVAKCKACNSSLKDSPTYI